MSISKGRRITSRHAVQCGRISMRPRGTGMGSVRALKPQTGEVQWEFKLKTPPWAGVMSTAGGLVFGGTTQGEFFALDSTSGKSLWNFETGGDIHSNPISYLSGGRQQIAIASGHAILVFALE